jgi:hypothetical protein
MMPVNTRPAEWFWEVVGNFASFASISTHPAQRTDQVTAVRAVQEQTAPVYRAQRAGRADRPGQTRPRPAAFSQATGLVAAADHREPVRRHDRALEPRASARPAALPPGRSAGGMVLAPVCHAGRSGRRGGHVRPEPVSQRSVPPRAIRSRRRRAIHRAIPLPTRARLKRGSAVPRVRSVPTPVRRGRHPSRARSDSVSCAAGEAAHCWSASPSGLQSSATPPSPGRPRETTASERQQPRRPTRPRLPVRPGDAAVRRRRPDGHPPPLATNSWTASTRAAASPASVDCWIRRDPAATLGDPALLQSGASGRRAGDRFHDPGRPRRTLPINGKHQSGRPEARCSFRPGAWVRQRAAALVVLRRSSHGADATASGVKGLRLAPTNAWSRESPRPCFPPPTSALGDDARPAKRGTGERRALAHTWSVCRRFLLRYMTVSANVAARSPWRDTSAMRRACRSRRSPSAWAARPRRSRPTSTTRRGRRRGRSRPATSACAAAAAPTPSRATARGTPTGTASAATPARSNGSGRRELVIAAMLEWLNSYGSLPSSYDWSRTHAKRRGGVALKRLGDGRWPSASVVGQLFGTWQLAREAAAVGGGAATAAGRHHLG